MPPGDEPNTEFEVIIVAGAGNDDVTPYFFKILKFLINSIYYLIY